MIPLDVRATILEVGDPVVFAVIGNGSNHGGVLGEGIIEEIDSQSVCRVRNEETGRICRRHSTQLAKVPT